MDVPWHYDTLVQSILLQLWSEWLLSTGFVGCFTFWNYQSPNISNCKLCKNVSSLMFAECCTISESNQTWDMHNIFFQKILPYPTFLDFPLNSSLILVSQKFRIGCFVKLSNSLRNFQYIKTIQCFLILLQNRNSLSGLKEWRLAQKTAGEI